jgi:hypothetical protein
MFIEQQLFRVISVLKINEQLIYLLFVTMCIVFGNDNDSDHIHFVIVKYSLFTIQSYCER